MRKIMDDNIVPQLAKDLRVNLLPQDLPAMPTKVSTDQGSVHRQLRAAKRVGPNKACPCGSTKKYKRCCGANQANLFDEEQEDASNPI